MANECASQTQPPTLTREWLESFRDELVKRLTVELRRAAEGKAIPGKPQVKASEPERPEHLTMYVTVRERMRELGWLSASTQQHDQVRNLALMRIGRENCVTPHPTMFLPGAEVHFRKDFTAQVDDAIVTIWEESRRFHGRPVAGPVAV